MEARELRIGNWVKYNNEYSDVYAIHFWDSQMQPYRAMLGNVRSKMGVALSEIAPIKLTPEILEKAGFRQLPHFTIQDSWFKELGRDRFISVACVGSGNEMVFITEEVPPKVKSVIVARNYDYDGKTYLHQLQNIHYAITGAELEINL